MEFYSRKGRGPDEVAHISLSINQDCISSAAEEEEDSNRTRAKRN
jgi:hypothetical protein